jgi:preprotein translocase subunit SecA
VNAHTPGPNPEDWDLRGLQGELRTFFPLSSDFNFEQSEDLSPPEIENRLSEIAERAYDEINRAVGHQVFRQAMREDLSLQALAESADPAHQMTYRRLSERMADEPSDAQAAQSLYQLPEDMQSMVEEAFVDTYRLFRDRQLMLQAVDSLWVRHLTNLGDLREGIGLRAYGQQNPLVAYRKEAHEMYQSLLARIQRRVARSVYLLPKALAAQPERRRLRPARRSVVTSPAARPPRSRGAAVTARRQPGPAKNVRPDCDLGRNDPCWCGSGKKYKYCHMRKDQQARRTRAAAA